MARRSAMNERYQKQNAHSGKTRKSASSAKPKREAGTYSTSPKKAPVKKKERFFAPLPSSPEIKKWRLVWYVLIGVAVASYAFTLYAQKLGNEVLLSIGLGVELTAVAVAIGIDLIVIRRLRKEVMAEQKAGKKGSAKAVGKASATSDNKDVAKDAKKDPS